MGFGDFEKLCRTIPSYPQCNLFFRQVYGQLGSGQGAIDLNAAGVGVNPECSILRVGDGRLGNIADTILCGLSAIISLFLIIAVSKRQAAVGRVEFRGFVCLYLLSCVFQIFSLGSFLRQATTGIVVLTAIHMGIVAALFWSLLMNAVVSLQWVEDGTMSSLVPLYGGAALFFIGTTYVSLDTGFTWTSGFETSVQDGLHNIPLFVLTNIWPGAVAVIFFVVMLYVIAVILRERRPLVFYIVAFILFAGAQVIRYVASKPLCDTANGKVDGSFLGTFLETASVITLYLGWKSITEDSWDDPWNTR